MAPSYVFAGVGGYYASKQSGLAGVFRATDDTNWKHAVYVAARYGEVFGARDGR